MNEFAAGLSLVLLTNALGMFSPGPDMLLLMRNSSESRAGVAYATVFGITTGIAVHISLSLAGVTGLALQNREIFHAFLLLAGLYLFYLGLAGLRPAHRFRSRAGDAPEAQADRNEVARAPTDAPGLATDGKSGFAAYREGLLCNVLNVKAAAFFVSLFGLVIGPDSPHARRVALGIVCVIECALLWSLFVWLLRRGFARRILLERLARVMPIFNALLILAGCVLIYQALVD